MKNKLGGRKASAAAGGAGSAAGGARGGGGGGSSGVGSGGGGGGAQGSGAESAMALYAEPLPTFRDVSAGERQALFCKKLQLCAATFDFNDATAHVKEKEVKRQTLLELVDYVNTGSGKFVEAVFDDIAKMLSANLFRALPPSERMSSGKDSESYDPEEEEPTLEPAWPHLQIVYEFLLRYIVSNETEAKQAKKYISTTFVLKLLELFDSEDPRERDYLKTILHRIYGKFMVHRPFIRKAIFNIFSLFIYETERHNGVAELLEILGSIINGFALPLKDEHKTFLMKALLPLHKPKSVGMYHQQLSYCVSQFAEKDPKLAEVVILRLLKYWPVTNSQKEVLFLGELEEILELTQAAEFQKVMVPLCHQIARCLRSSHFGVAERTLFLFNSDYIWSLLAMQNRQTTLPILFDALDSNSNSHWNAQVLQLTTNVVQLFKSIDEAFWAECAEKHEAEKKARTEQETQRADNWARLEKAAEDARARR